MMSVLGGPISLQQNVIAYNNNGVKKENTMFIKIQICNLLPLDFILCWTLSICCKTVKVPLLNFCLPIYFKPDLIENKNLYALGSIN